MLKSFSVCNCLGFKDELILDLSNIRDYKFNENCIKDNIVKNAIIYGKNAVGKTNLMRAILDIFCTNSDIPMMLPDGSRYKNADASDEELIAFKYSFVLDNQIVDYLYQKTDFFNVVSEKLMVNGTKIYEYNRLKDLYDFENTKLIGVETLDWDAFENIEIVAGSDNPYSLTALRYIYRNTTAATTSIIGPLMSFIVNMRGLSSFGMLRYSQRPEALNKLAESEDEVKQFQQFLNQFGVNCKLTVIENAEGKKDIYFDHLKPLNFSKNMSSGTKQLTAFYMNYIFPSKTPSILLFDEFDANFHFELSEKTVRMLENTFECQVILTSHNTSLLSNTIMRPDCYFILNDGKITPICDATDRELRQGHNLEKLLRNGEFNEF